MYFEHCNLKCNHTQQLRLSVPYPFMLHTVESKQHQLQVTMGDTIIVMFPQYIYFRFFRLKRTASSMLVSLTF